MSNCRLIVLIITTVTAFSTLYAPQPMHGIFVEVFGVSRQTSSLLITSTMLPLSFAPLAIGFLLEAVSAKRVIRTSLCLLALTQLAIGIAGNFSFILAMRFIQGLLAPALFTSIMTYISTHSEKESVSRQLSLYVGATVMGGFTGRALAGLFSSLLGWRAPFLILSASLLACAILTASLDSDADARFEKLQFSAIWKILKKPGFLLAYFIIFCCFFSFAAILNFLPFRIVDISHGSSEFFISMMYSGYLMGILVSLFSHRIISRVGSERKAIILGVVIFILAGLAYLIPTIPSTFAAMFLLCTGMFTVHSIIPGVLNRFSSNGRGVVNGLYICFYYCGGTLGSYAPGFIFHESGWTMFILSICLVLAAALLLAFRLPPAD